MSKLNIAFFGAPAFSAHVLEKIILELSDKVIVKSVFTQPDRPAGREQTLTPTPVKLLAQKYNIPVVTDLLRTTNYTLPAHIDLALLFAYGQLLPLEILKIPRWGFWNIHPSLLPKYRGVSPIVYSLLMGDKTTGVSLIELDDKMDHGPILAQEVYEIQQEDTREDLEIKLSDIGYKIFKQSIQLLLDGPLHKIEQNHDNRTFTRLLTKKDGFIPFPVVQKIIRGETLTKDETPPIISEYYEKNKLSPHSSLGSNSNLDLVLEFWNFYRGLSPWPGIWTLIPGDKRLKITEMKLTDGKPKITKVQHEGKKEVDFATFNTAYKIC